MRRPVPSAERIPTLRTNGGRPPARASASSPRRASTTAPTTSVAGGPIRASAAVAGRSSKVPTTVRCSGVAAHCTIAAGSSGGRPAAIRSRARLGELAGGHQDDERVGRGRDAREVDLVAVRGAARHDREALRQPPMRDGYARQRRRRDGARDPGHHLERHAGAAQRASPRRRGRTRTDRRPSGARPTVRGARVPPADGRSRAAASRERPGSLPT